MTILCSSKKYWWLSISLCENFLSDFTNICFSMMLEDQENREIQLLGIVNICNLEAQKELEQQSAGPPLLLPCANCKVSIVYNK